MIWGRAAASVPALGFWGVLLLGAVLGAVGVRLLRGARPRALGVLALALAIAIPLSAGAVTLITFTNGTVADANQVNANFAALTPVSGFNQMTLGFTAIGSQSDLFTPSFVAPRAMTCTVSVETSVVASSAPVGTALVRATKNENGVISFAFGPPQNGSLGVGLALTVAGGPSWNMTQTRQFSVSAGSTVSFGSRIIATGDFTSATSMIAAIVYNCI
jgi:hypothetical protein